VTVENVLFVSVDSLRRDHLGAYADEPTTLDRAVETPNLDRFAERAAVFDTHYAGSLPCMPARREWLTGVQEFLWRPWGPIEPFDDPIPQVCRREGVLSQLITDHYHYFEHGSHGYTEDFNGMEFVRGHETDQWQTTPKVPPERHVAQANAPAQDPTGVGYSNRATYARNVADFDELDERDFFAPRVFARTSEWLRANRDWERWFCYVDSFDVHEPFHCPEPYASMYTDENPTDPELTYWPFYGRTGEGQGGLSERELDFVQAQFAGKTTMVDRWFGRVLDALDREGLWDETMVVVTSDHGHYLGDHGWVGKPGAPLYDVLAHTPLLVHHPDGRSDRVGALTSAVDLYATVLEALGAPVSDRVHSRSLLPLVEGRRDDHRDWALYGYWGSSVNVTDGRYTYFHPTDPDAPAACFSTEMMNPHRWFQPPTPQEDAEPAQLPYADAPVWRYEALSGDRHSDPMLFDTRADPGQETDLAGDGRDDEARMRDLLSGALDELDAPESVPARLGLD
jgi:arylsulfatase A-like enzyme